MGYLSTTVGYRFAYVGLLEKYRPANQEPGGLERTLTHPPATPIRRPANQSI
jgi:hypothetical protein